MPEITQFDIAHVMHNLPELVPWNPALVSPGHIDVLICCAGFEDRATAIVNDVIEISIDQVAIVVYATNTEDNAPALDKLRQISARSEHKELPYDRHNFFACVRKCLELWKDRDGVRVVIDLSGMASFVAYRVLKAVWDELPSARLGIYYAEASGYSPTRDEWAEFYENVTNPHNNLAMAESYEETHFQSKGVDDAYESEVFPGLNTGSLHTEVLAIPSFSLLRMKAMLTHVDSLYGVSKENVQWFLGQPPDIMKNGWRFDALAKLYNVQQHGVAVSTRDYREVFQKLSALWEELHIERHLVIASVASKMQHLGTFLFLTMHPECGLLLCEPQEFIAEKFSDGVGSKWWLDFGTISELDQVLRSHGELRFHW